MKHQLLLALILSAGMISPVCAQLSVYPANGQTPEQQQTDETECYQWAVEQTGIDPAAPPPVQQAASQQQMDTYYKANAACLEGRGYSVK